MKIHVLYSIFFKDQQPTLPFSDTNGNKYKTWILHLIAIYCYGLPAKSLQKLKAELNFDRLS